MLIASSVAFSLHRYIPTSPPLHSPSPPGCSQWVVDGFTPLLQTQLYLLLLSVYIFQPQFYFETYKFILKISFNPTTVAPIICASCSHVWTQAQSMDSQAHTNNSHSYVQGCKLTLDRSPERGKNCNWRVKLPILHAR